MSDNDEINEIIDSYTFQAVIKEPGLFSQVLEFNSDNLHELFMSLSCIKRDLMIKIDDNRDILEDIVTNSPDNIDIIKVSYKHNMIFSRTKYVINVSCLNNGFLKILFKNPDFVNKQGVKYSSFISGKEKVIGVFREEHGDSRVDLGVNVSGPVKDKDWVSDKFLKNKKTNTICFKINNPELNEKIIKDFTEFCVLCTTSGNRAVVEINTGIIKELENHCSSLQGLPCEDVSFFKIDEYVKGVVCILKFIEETVANTFKMNCIVFADPGMIDLAYNNGGAIDEDVFEFYKKISEFVKKNCRYCDLGYGLGCFSGIKSCLFDSGFTDTSDYYTFYHDNQKYYNFIRIFLFPCKQGDESINIGIEFEEEPSGNYIFTEKEWKYNLARVKFMYEALYNLYEGRRCLNTYFLNLSNGYPTETVEISEYTKKKFRQPKKESSASLFFLGGKVDTGKFMRRYRDSFFSIKEERGETHSDAGTSIAGCIFKDKLGKTLNLKALFFQSSSVKQTLEDMYTIQLISKFS